MMIFKHVIRHSRSKITGKCIIRKRNSNEIYYQKKEL